jgi:hypothetical protein
MTSLTIFESPRWWEEKNRYVYDNKTHRRLDLQSFDDLEKLLYNLASKPLNGKAEAYLISPAVFNKDGTRKNDNVIEWSGWAAVDVDDMQIEGNIKEKLDDMFPTWRYVCYSTASSTKEQPKFRIVFGLSKPVKNKDITAFWFGLQTAIGEIGDKQTKDKARMYYIPATYQGAYNFIFSGKGNRLIDPDDIMRRYPYSEKIGDTFLDRLPDAWRDQIIEYRKNSLNNDSITWTNYLDCPFWPKRLANEYKTITDTGWYRQMYRIMIAVAGNAVKKQYPIKSKQIADLCKQFDIDTGNWYENRPMEIEADRAIEYVYRNM